MSLLSLVRDNFRLHAWRRKFELECDEALPRTQLEILYGVLIPGIVGSHKLKTCCRLYQLTRLVDRQDLAIITECMSHDDGVLTRFDQLIQVADGANPCGDRERSVCPHSFAATDQVTASEITCGEIVVANNRYERSLETPRHVLDEARLSASRRASEHDREAACVTGREDVYLIADRDVIWRVGAWIVPNIAPR